MKLDNEQDEAMIQDVRVEKIENTSHKTGRLAVMLCYLDDLNDDYKVTEYMEDGIFVDRDDDGCCGDENPEDDSFIIQSYLYDQINHEYFHLLSAQATID